MKTLLLESRHVHCTVWSIGFHAGKKKKEKGKKVFPGHAESDRVPGNPSEREREKGGKKIWNDPNPTPSTEARSAHPLYSM